jgi:hypothetical protein
LAIFLSIFALDVFDESHGFWETMLALLIHLVPTVFVVVALVIAWQREGLGAILFIALPLFYLVMRRGQSWIISGPLFLVGVLFLFNWIFRTELKRQ